MAESDLRVFPHGATGVAVELAAEHVEQADLVVRGSGGVDRRHESLTVFNSRRPTGIDLVG